MHEARAGERAGLQFPRKAELSIGAGAAGCSTLAMRSHAPTRTRWSSRTTPAVARSGLPHPPREAKQRSPGDFDVLAQTNTAGALRKRTVGAAASKQRSATRRRASAVARGISSIAARCACSRRKRATTRHRSGRQDAAPSGHNRPRIIECGAYPRDDDCRSRPRERRRSRKSPDACSLRTLGRVLSYSVRDRARRWRRNAVHTADGASHRPACRGW